MKRKLRCVHNKAINPEMGVVCDLKHPNSLCKNCKTFKSKYPSYCCQKCGEHIGLIGRFVEWICCGLIKHKCKSKTKEEIILSYQDNHNKDVEERIKELKIQESRSHENQKHYIETLAQICQLKNLSKEEIKEKLLKTIEEILN
jgi:hypothetical protein